MLARLRMSMGEMALLEAPWGWWGLWKVSIKEVKSSGNLSASSVRPSMTSPISLSRSVTAFILLTLTFTAGLCKPSFLCKTCCLRIGLLCFWGISLTKLRGGVEKRCFTCWGGLGRKLLSSLIGALSGLWLAFVPEMIFVRPLFASVIVSSDYCQTNLELQTSWYC